MVRIPRNFLLVGCLLLAVLTAGCYDTKDEYTVNPDGSGKVIHECAYHEITLNQDSGESDPDETLRKSVSQFLSQAKGVDAWSDVTYKIQDDGRMYFRGTAYFKDLSKLDLGSQQFLKFDWKANSLGTATLSWRSLASTNSSSAKSPTVASATNSAKKARDDLFHYQQAKPLLTIMLGDLKNEAIFHLPGKISSSTMQKGQNGSVSMNFSGAKLLSLINEHIKDTNWLSAHSSVVNSAGSSEPQVNDELMGEVFGAKAPFEAKIDGATKPLFDYAAEVAAAGKQSAKLQAELETAPITKSVAAAPPAGTSLSNLKVAGIQMISTQKPKSGLAAFSGRAGVSLSIFADVPPDIHSFTDKGELETAVADNGDDLLPEKDWDRRLQFPRLSQDKTGAAFEVSLKLPAGSVKALKEISGHLEYTTVGTTRDVDLGFTELAEKARGTNLGAVINSIKDGMVINSERELDLKLNIKPDTLKEMDLVVDGVRTRLSDRGYSGFNDTYTYTLGSKNPIPAKGNLVAVVYADVKTIQLPFKLENVSLYNLDGASR